jgi:DNA repair protein RadC
MAGCRSCNGRRAEVEDCATVSETQALFTGFVTCAVLALSDLVCEGDVHELGVADRPREKLARHGAAALGDNELVAAVIGHGRAGIDALAVANSVLAAAGGVRGLTRVPREQLAAIPGVGAAQACRLIAAVELGRRTLVRPTADRPQLLRSSDAAAHLLPTYGSHPVERFGLVLVDARYRLIGTRLLSVGSLTGSLVHPREVFREALLTGAAAVIVFHNHPSGDPKPSRDDVAVSVRLQDAGKLVGVPLLDSLVLADDRFASLRDMGLLK